MDKLRGKTILVLGGSGALGSLITSALIDHGAQVMATTTSNEKGDLIPSAASPRLLLDLERDESIGVLVNYLIQSGAKIDGIVNATGVVAFGPASELAATTIKRLNAVNLTGPITLVSGLLPALRVSAQAGHHLVERPRRRAEGIELAEEVEHRRAIRARLEPRAAVRERSALD